MRTIIICISYPTTDHAMPTASRLACALILATGLLVGSPAFAADDEFKLVIENRDATPEEFESHALNREKVIAGKSTASVFIGPLKPGRYEFVGEYNEKTAKGVVIAK